MKIGWWGVVGLVGLALCGCEGVAQPDLATAVDLGDAPVDIAQTDAAAARPSASRSRVVVSAAPALVADGVARATVTVSIVDDDDAPLTGVPISVFVSGTGNTVTPAGPTGAGGVAQAFLVSTKAEEKTISVLAGANGDELLLLQQSTVTFVAGPAARLSIVTAPVRAVVRLDFAVAVAIEDAFGNTTTRADAVALTLGQGAGGVVLGGTTTAAAIHGVATFMVSVNAPTGACTIVARSGALAAATSDPFDVVAGAVAEISSNATISPLPVTADGASYATVNVVAKDAFQNFAVGRPVVVTVSGSNNVVTPSVLTTDAMGRASVRITSTTVEQKVIRVSVDGVLFPQALTVRFVGWTPSSNGFQSEDGFGNAIAVDPVAPNAVYSVVGRMKLNRSTTGAASWFYVDLGPTDEAGHDVIVPSPHVVYVAGKGVYKSSMGGDLGTWAAAHPGGAPLKVHGLAADPTNADVLFAATEAGIYKTIDAAASWALVDAAVVARVVVDPNDTAIVYGVGPGLRRTMNGGASWSDGALPPSAQARQLAAAPGQPGTLYLAASKGAFASSDGGATWRALANPVGTAFGFDAIVVDPVVPSTLYAVTGGTLYKSTVGGDAWTVSLPLGCTAIAMDPSDRRTLYAATTQGMYKTTSGGD